MEGQTATLQDAFIFDYSASVDANGRVLGTTVPTAVHPRFTELDITLLPDVLETGNDPVVRAQ